MFSFRASFWNTDVYINGHEKYAANEILTAYLNAVDSILRIKGIDDLKDLQHDLTIEADMSCDLIQSYNSHVWKAAEIFDRLNEAIDRMPPYDKIFVRGHRSLPDLLNEYKELFVHHIHPDDMYDEEKSRIVHFVPDVGWIEWPEPDLPESAQAFNEVLHAFFGEYLDYLAACREVKNTYIPFITEVLHRDSAFPDTHTLAKMFDEFEGKMGHPFQKMKCRMGGFAYKPQKDADGRMIFCEQIEFLDLRSFLYYDFWNGLRLNRLPTKCRLCGRYFLLEGGRYSPYCSNPLSDEPDKPRFVEAELVEFARGANLRTCRDVGSKRRYDDRCKTDPVWQTYNRAYKTHYARYMKKKMTAGEFEAWSRHASELRDRAAGELISFEEYCGEIRQ